MAEAQLNLVSPEFIRRVERLERWQASLQVSGAARFSNTRDGATIYIDRPQVPGQARTAARVAVAYRMKVTATASVDHIAECRKWDGSQPSGDTVAVLIHQPYVTGDQMLACEPVGGTESPDYGVGGGAATPVTWIELRRVVDNPEAAMGATPSSPQGEVTMAIIPGSTCGVVVSKLGEVLGWYEGATWQSPHLDVPDPGMGPI